MEHPCLGSAPAPQSGRILTDADAVRGIRRANRLGRGNGIGIGLSVMAFCLIPAFQMSRGARVTALVVAAMVLALSLKRWLDAEAGLLHISRTLTQPAEKAPAKTEPKPPKLTCHARLAKGQIVDHRL